MSDAWGDLPPAAAAALAEVLGRDDPAMIGVVLSGSAARGTATPHSDVDVYVVLRDGVAPRPVLRSTAIDAIPIPLATLERRDTYGTDGWWQRWSFAWARVLRDDLDGRIAAAVRAQATLTPAEQDAVLAARLDGALNLWYRALKSDRAGRPTECRLDAAESVPWWLDCLFALEGRVRPYNAYLAWELREHPLTRPAWSAAHLLPLVDRVLAGDPAAISKAFTELDRACRERDEAHGKTALTAIIDDWGSELALLRGPKPG